MHCRSCGQSKTLIEILNLNQTPWCNNFLTKEEIGNEPKYPLVLMFCKNCELVQLSYTVKKEVMFSHHTYVSGTTKTLSEHFII